MDSVKPSGTGATPGLLPQRIRQRNYESGTELAMAATPNTSGSGKQKRRESSRRVGLGESLQGFEVLKSTRRVASSPCRGPELNNAVLRGYSAATLNCNRGYYVSGLYRKVRSIVEGIVGGSESPGYGSMIRSRTA